MLPNKRKFKSHRRAKRRIIFILPFVCSIVLILAASIGYLIFRRLSMPLFVSPIAQAVLSISASQEDTKLANFKKLLAEKNIFYTSLVQTKGDYTLTLEDGLQVILSGQKDENEQISSLQFILTRLTMESRQVKSLDLRFDKPVILFK